MLLLQPARLALSQRLWMLTAPDRVSVLFVTPMALCLAELAASNQRSCGKCCFVFFFGIGYNQRVELQDILQENSFFCVFRGHFP